MVLNIFSCLQKLLHFIDSNDLKNWNVKQGVSERSVHLVHEHANAPKFCGTNSSKQKSIQKYKQKAIKLLRQISFAVEEFCICLSKILNQVKICSRFVHFSNPHYIFTLKNLFILFSKNNLRLCLNNLKNRPLAKPTYAQGFGGDASPRTVAYSNVREDSSTASLSKLPAEVEVCKRSNWFRKTTSYAGAFVPNVHMSYFLFVLYYNSSNHSSIHYF